MNRRALIIGVVVALLSTVRMSAQDTCHAWEGLVYRVSDGALPPGLSLDRSTGTITGTPSTGGRFSFTIEAATGCSATTRSYTLDVIPAPPANFVATATSTADVALSWSAVTGGSYEVHRSVDNRSYTLLMKTSSTSANDTGLDPNTSYLYKVRTIVSGVDPSAFSPVNAATTIMFSDDPLAVGSVMKANHVTQLRTAVNAIRTAGGLSSGAYTDPELAAGTAIRAVHITELRARLNDAISAIGLPRIVYVDPVITAGATVIKAGHVTDLRDGVK